MLVYGFSASATFDETPCCLLLTPLPRLLLLQLALLLLLVLLYDCLLLELLAKACDWVQTDAGAKDGRAQCSANTKSRS
jgi:hypothetical protein